MARAPSSTRTWRVRRTSAQPPDPVDAAGKAGTFGAAVRNTGAAVLVTVCDEQSRLAQYVVVPAGRNPERVAGNLAPAVGARVEACAAPDLSGTGAVLRLVARPSSAAARETQAGARPEAVAQFLAGVLTAGMWVAVVMRAPSKREVWAARRWYDFRLGGAVTHHAKSGNVLVVEVLGGGGDPVAVQGVLQGLASALPGFDVEVSARAPIGGVSAAAACLAVAAALLVAVHGVGPSWAGLAVSLPTLGGLLRAAVGVLLVAAVGLVVGLVPTPRSTLLSRCRRGVFGRPARRWLRPRAPRRERTDGGRVVPEFTGDYPLARTAFLLGPSVLIGVASPHAGASAGAAVTDTRMVPPALRQRVGPLVGRSGTGGSTQVFISQADRFQGVGMYGLPGSGKTALINTLFAYDCLARKTPAAAGPGRVGGRNAMVVFESKGAEGVAVYRRWLALTGTPAVMVEVADPATPSIDLFDVAGPAPARAAFFVDAMVYAFGEQSIAYQSQNTLKIVATAALLTAEEDLVAVGLAGDLSTVEVMSVYLSGRGDQVGQDLAGAFTRRAAGMDPGTPDGAQAHQAVQRLSVLYGPGVSVSARRALTSAPTSKVETLLTSPQWWSRSRPRLSLARALDEHLVLLVNTGMSTSGRCVNATVTQHLTSMLMFALRAAIESTCAGWRSQDRAVTIYSDELSLLVGAGNPQAFKWLRDQGRSFGVWPVMASQRPEQLPAEVRSAVQSYGTFFWFKQNDPATIAAAVADLTAGGGSWSGADVTLLADHHALLRATVAGQRQDPVPVALSYWGEGGERAFHAEQGFEDPVPGFEALYPHDPASVSTRRATR